MRIKQIVAPDRNVELMESGEIATTIGIQAPSGTKFSINNKTIVVGPSQVYELDNVIRLTSLKATTLIDKDKTIIDLIIE